ncbi:hypothetical protein IFR05_002784 [Cadophora sp. M221]|nr:hypothetical protein IFR05_002784 [Cadophora sp. M221]
MTSHNLAPGGTFTVNKSTRGIIPATLSPTSLVHLRDARFELVIGEFRVNSLGDQLINGYAIRAEDAEPEFPQFAKLPTELQDKIWSFCIPLLPRKVDITDTDDQQVQLARTRAETTTIYGYARLQSLEIANGSFLLNPEVDMLFLSHEDLRAT